MEERCSICSDWLVEKASGLMSQSDVTSGMLYPELMSGPRHPVFQKPESSLEGLDLRYSFSGAPYLEGTSFTFRNLEVQAYDLVELILTAILGHFRVSSPGGVSL
jgi:hypothetical protein